MNKYLSVRRVIMGIIACFLGFALMGCEADELVDYPGVSVDTTADLKAKSELGKLPHKEIAQVRASVAAYHNFETAVAAGWNVDLTGYVPHMGHHFADFTLFDQDFDMLNPEILIFTGDLEDYNDRVMAGEEFSNADARLVGVEYIIPIADLNNPPPAPEGFPGDADVWTINKEAQAWTLHLWIGLKNPDGIFEMHNMRLP